MKKLLIASIALCLGASVVSADIYHCKFSPKKSRGWAPSDMFIDTTTNNILFFGEVVEASNSGRAYFWRSTLQSNAGFTRAKYTMRLRAEMAPGVVVPSRIEIDVSGNQREKSDGTCEIFEE